MNPVRVVDEFLAHVKKPEWHGLVGVRLTKAKEIEAFFKSIDEEPSGCEYWVKSPVRLLQVECGPRIKNEVLAALYEAFNNTKDRMAKPGKYEFRFIPEVKYMPSGSDSAASRTRMIKQHGQCIESMSVVVIPNIKYLDKGLVP